MIEYANLPDVDPLAPWIGLLSNWDSLNCQASKLLDHAL